MIHISVIVPVHNNCDGLRKCLAALLKQTLGSPYEVIVVDNGSTDALPAVQRDYPTVIWLAESKPGSYCARNRALAAARGQILAFTDSDCVPEPTWLEYGVRDLEAAGARIGAGRIEFEAASDREMNIYEVFEANTFTMADQEATVKLRGYGATANLFAMKEVFSVVGEFDSKLKSGGDQDWGRRAKQVGIDTIYLRDAVIIHPRRGTFSTVARKMRRIAGGRIMLLAKSHPSFAQFLDFLFNRSFLDYRIYIFALYCPGIKSRRRRSAFVGFVVLMSAITLMEKLRVSFGGRPCRG